MVSVIKANPATVADPALVSDPGGGRIVGGRTTFTLFGFSLGMIGDRIFRDAPALLLLIFMTDYLAIPPAIAGLAIFIPKILIVFVDPMVGALSDRLRTPWGRRRPLMFVGAILASASIVLFFHVPDLGSPMAGAAYISALVFLGFTGYSLFSVPYLTMASEMAEGETERRMIMSWRVAFMAMGLSVSAFAGGVIQSLGGGFGGYASMSWIYAGICLVTMLSTVAACREEPAPAEATRSLTLAAQIRLVMQSDRYLRLLLVGFLQKLGEGVGYGSFAYFCTYVVRQPLSAIGLVVLASVAGQILTQPLWLRASRRWSPTTLYAAGVLGWCLNLVLWLGMIGQSIWWLIPLGLQGGAAAGGFLMITLSSLSNTMAADAAESGVKREGVYGGFWLGAEKLAFALGALIVGGLLGLFGFVESRGGVHVTQSATAVLGIGVTYVGVNMLIYLISILAMRRVARFDPPRGGVAAA
jgi:GPH family glycoside/pentoside/hexuronide:cation symporter